MTPLSTSGERLVVLHSHPTWLPQTQTWMYNLVRNLPDDVIEAHIMCEITKNLDQFAVSNIHSMSDGPRLQYIWNKALRKLRIRNYLGFSLGVARRISASVLHSHFGNVGWTEVPVARRAGLRHIVTFYGYDLSLLPTANPRWKARYLELFAAADLFVCEGPHMAETLESLGCPGNKIRVLHIGIDTDSIRYEPRQWGPGERLRILISGSFREKKGIPYALRALASIRDAADIEITIIGDANNEPRGRDEKTKILSELDGSGLQPVTRLMGYQPYAVLLEEARSHHIFLSPSVTADDGDSEGGAPVTIIEMMASGMPIVSTNHCDIPEVVTYGGADWLAPERDPAALADRLRWLIANPNEWRPMLDEGRARAVSEFDVATQASRLAELYHMMDAQ